MSMWRDSRPVRRCRIHTREKSFSFHSWAERHGPLAGRSEKSSSISCFSDRRKTGQRHLISDADAGWADETRRGCALLRNLFQIGLWNCESNERLELTLRSPSQVIRAFRIAP